MSAREVLYARCPRCEMILNWVWSQTDFGAGASCCEFAVTLDLNPEGHGPTEFRIYVTEVNWGSNVYPIFK